MPGWTKHQNFVPDKTSRAFDLEMMKTSKAKDVTRTIKQDKNRLDQQLKNVSRDYKKRMNQLQSETDKWKKKAEKLRETKDLEDGMERPSSQMLARRRGSLDSNLLMAQQREFMRGRSRTMISVDDFPGTQSPEPGSRINSGRNMARRGSLDPAVLLKQKDFFSKIAKLSSSQSDIRKEDEISKSDGDDDKEESPPASPPPMSRSRQGRRGSLPIMHLGGVQGSRPPVVGQLPPLELIQEVERRGSQNSEADKENEFLERMKLENDGGESKIPEQFLQQRRSSFGESARKRSPRPEHNNDDNQSEAGSVATVTSSARGYRSRSNSLFDTRSVRLTRRRNSTPAPEDSPPETPSLVEQFAKLSGCRYLRSRNSIQDEDCDLSNVFG